MKATLILLKCRPTPAQVADRLAAPAPEGLELYLAAEDIQGADWLARTVDLLASWPRPAGFALVVEGPLRSLDGAYFDLTRDTEANREVVSRVAALGRALGAAAANVHAIAPVGSAEGLGGDRRAEALRAALPLLRHYARACEGAGLRPLLENIPPVARMREGAYVYTPIGMAPDDLLWLAAEVPGVGFTLDLSHAQLFLNALATPAEAAPAELRPLLRSLQGVFAAGSPSFGPPNQASRGLGGYVDALAPGLVNVHVSNASGLLGEGLPYGDGDADLDSAVARALGVADYLVTETLETDPDRAGLMREAQARLLAIRDRAAGRIAS